MLETVPWFIGGGAEHSPAVARMLAYSATGGTNGVASWPDLRVTALNIPGTSVTVSPGGAIMLNKYPGGGQQTYIARNMSSTDVAVPATGSQSGATRYVILRVDDPEFGAQLPANVVEGPYNRFAVVDSITNLNYPHVVLARITMPAATGTVTNAMITDLRAVANPRSKREISVGYSTNADLPNTSYVQWPNYTANIFIPEWATRVEGFARVHGALVMNNVVYGDYRIQFGTITSGVASYDFNEFGTANNGLRVPTLSCVIGAAIPDAMRGTTQTVLMQGRKIREPGFLRADSGTQVEYDLNFEERPI
jgi:hypothetical protein